MLLHNGDCALSVWIEVELSTSTSHAPSSMGKPFNPRVTRAGIAREAASVGEVAVVSAKVRSTVLQPFERRGLPKVNKGQSASARCGPSFICSNTKATRKVAGARTCVAVAYMLGSRNPPISALLCSSCWRQDSAEIVHTAPPW